MNLKDQRLGKEGGYADGCRKPGFYNGPKPSGTFVSIHPAIIHTTIQPSKNPSMYIVSHYFALNIVPYSCVVPDQMFRKNASVLEELPSYSCRNFEKVKSVGTTV